MKKQTLFYLLTVLLITGLHGSVMGQVKDTIPASAGVSGIVWDSTFHHALQDVTVVIYRAKDSTMVQFCITDVYGKFKMQKLPLNTPLYILFSYVGYETISKNFILTIPNTEYDFEKLTIRKVDQLLKEVVVTSNVPVRINKDTIEFNPRAFNLDSSAVVEDLMRRLPGMTVWGDGTITLNGREIKSLTVNGKPFLGQSFKIATQNIPKTAVDKIQVFNQVNVDDPLDTLTKMNIKLLKGHESGYFGKVGAGRGTDNRYLFEGTLSFFNTRNQLSVGGAYNNINKVAHNMTTFLENSSFKGLSASIDDQPNFRQEGINKSYVAGIGYRHNFSDRIDYNHNNAIKLDYFLKNQDLETDRKTGTFIYLNEFTKLEQSRIRTVSQKATNNDVSVNYNFLNFVSELDITPFFSTTALENSTTVFENSKSNDILQSTNTSQSQSDYTSTEYGLKINYKNLNSYYTAHKKPLRDFKISYSLLKGKVKETRSVNTNFNSVNGNSRVILNRNYQNKLDKISHQIGFDYNLDRLLFRMPGSNSPSFKLVENIKISEQKPEDVVYDYDSTLSKYKLNNYLSNVSTYKSVQNDLSLIFDKPLYRRSLSGRYYKSATISLEMLGQSFYQKNTSQKSFQNIKQSYFKSLPEINFTFSHSKFNYIFRTLNIKYTTTAIYPTIAQLAPLADSSNIWFLDMGNPRLLPSIDKQIKISFTKSYTFKKDYKYQFELVGGVVKNRMADSTIYDVAGNAVHYIINVEGYKYVGAIASFKKAKKIKAHQFQILLNADVKYSRSPAYVNSALLFSNVLTASDNLSLLYTFQDYLAINVSQGIQLYSTIQKATDNKFENVIHNTSFAATGVFNKRINLSSDITFNRSSTTNTASVNFVIWNAHVAYRFTKKNSMEVKFSAMDLLKQNNGIISYGTPTSLTTGTTKVLKQYFMLTVSYFPRKF